MTIKERVAKGYEWLKANRPDRIKDIDVSAFDVNDVLHCPLGQTGGYHAALELVYPNGGVAVFAQQCQWSIDHGFLVSDTSATAQSWADAFAAEQQEIDALNDEWRKVLS